MTSKLKLALGAALIVASIAPALAEDSTDEAKQRNSGRVIETMANLPASAFAQAPTRANRAAPAPMTWRWEAFEKPWFDRASKIF